CHTGDKIQVNSQRLRSRSPALLRGSMEDDVAVGRQGQPGIGSNLCLELAFAPSGISQGNQIFLRSTTLSQCLDDIPRGRQVDARRNLEGGLPLLLAGVQHEAALNLYRPSG